jgi:hypothetical protein
MTQSQEILFAAILKLLRPLVRILLRNNIPYGAFSELVKKTYVEVAQEFNVEGKKQTKSRIATITGLTRREVVRVMETDSYNNVELIERFNRAARVVAGWVRDHRFTDADGEPTTLGYDGEGNTFSRLVASYSGDVPPRAVLDELRKAGVVEKEDNEVRLLARAYVPANSADEKLAILGTDVSFLLDSIDHNIYETKQKPYFQRKVYYDNLPQEVIPKLQAIVRDHGQKLIEVLDQWMAQHDRDRNKHSEGTGRIAAGVGLFYFQQDLSGSN